MPTVPRYDQPRVQEQGLPNKQISIDTGIDRIQSGNAKVTGAVNSALDEFAKYAEKEQKRQDDSVSLSLQTESLREKNRLLYSTQEDDPGAMMQKGGNAAGVVDNYSKRFSDFNNRIEEKAQNSAQREAFAQFRMRHETEFQESLYRHTAGEAMKYEADQFKSAIVELQNDAAYNWASPTNVTNSMVMQNGIIDNMANNYGWPEEQRRMAKLEAFSKTNLNVISRQADSGQYLQAMNQLEKNKAMMTAEDYKHAHSIVESASVLGESQKHATTIIGKYGSDMKASLAEARKIQDPKIQKATVDEIETRFVEMAKAKKQQEDANYTYASQFIEKTGEIPPAEIWQAIPVEDRTKLMTNMHNLRKGIEPNTNWSDYYNLKSMASSPLTRDKFLETNLDKEYRGKLADSEFKELSSLQSSIRNGDEKVVKDLDGFRSKQEIVNSTLSKAGIDPTPKRGSKDAEKTDLFRKRVDDEVMRWQDVNGKKIDNAEFQRIVDGQMVEVITKKGWIWDEKKKSFELSPENKIVDIDFKEIPFSERQLITDSLKKKNLPVNESTIKEVYKLNLEKKRGRQ